MQNNDNRAAGKATRPNGSVVEVLRNFEKQTHVSKEAVSVAQSKAIASIIYSSFREGIFEEGKQQFYVLLPNGKYKVLNHESEVLGFIYSSHVNDKVTFFQKKNSTLAPIKDAESLFSKVVIPFYKKENSTLTDDKVNVCLEKIKNSIENDALVIAFRDKWYQNIRKSNPDCQNMWEMVTSKENSMELDGFLMQFASLGGNRSHPLKKITYGFNSSQNKEYSPEYGNDVHIPIIALKASYCMSSSMHEQYAENSHSFLKAYFPQQYEAWLLELKNKNLDPIDYTPIPVHPYQLDAIKKDGGLRELPANSVVLLDNVSITTQPTMSLRTMMPKEGVDKPYIKLPIDIYKTNELRRLPFYTYIDGPTLSKKIAEILKHDTYFNNNLRIFNETYGVGLLDPSSYSEGKGVHSIHERLGVLYKENPQSHLNKDEFQVPLSGIFELSPFTKKPLIVDIMQHAGVQSKSDALQYFSQYIQKLLDGQLGMYLRYGISLECHQQNTHVVFDKNGHMQCTLNSDIAHGIGIRPQILDLREKDVIETLYPPTLRSHVLRPSMPEYQLLHTTFNHHIYPLIHVVSQTFNIKQEELYSIVGNVVSENIASAAKDTSWIQNPDDILLYMSELSRIKNILLKEPTPVRGVFSMAIEGVPNNIITRHSPNPLAESCGKTSWLNKVANSNEQSKSLGFSQAA